MIAAIAILLPAILHAQQGTPEAIARLPGMSWEGPPGEVEWEPVDQVGSTDGGAQDHATAREQHDEATERRQEQDLMAQQAMAEQAKRMADFMFWQIFFQIVVGVGVGWASRSTMLVRLRAALSSVDKPSRIIIPGASPVLSRVQPAPRAHINQQGNIKS